MRKQWQSWWPLVSLNSAFFSSAWLTNIFLFSGLYCSLTRIFRDIFFSFLTSLPRYQRAMIRVRFFFDLTTVSYALIARRHEIACQGKMILSEHFRIYLRNQSVNLNSPNRDFVFSEMSKIHFSEKWKIIPWLTENHPNCTQDLTLSELKK
jgi:hypothetical protein